MNEFLVAYLDAIDESLLDYLDEDEELRLDTVKRMRFYATALLEGSVTPAAVVEDWADWFDLVPAFAATYAPEGMEVLEEPPELMDGDESYTVLTEADKAYLAALEPLLDMYPEIRSAEGE